MYMGEEIRCVNLNSDLVHFLILYIIAWTIISGYRMIKFTADGVTTITSVIKHDSITLGVILAVFFGVKLACILQGL